MIENFLLYADNTVNVCQQVNLSHVLVAFYLSTSPFLKKLKTYLFHSSFSPSLYSPIGYLRTDISGIDQASFFILQTIRYYSPSFHSRQFDLFVYD